MKTADSRLRDASASMLAACAAAFLVLAAGRAVGQEAGEPPLPDEPPAQPQPGPAEQPPGDGALPGVEVGDEEVTLPSAPEPIQLRTLLDYTIDALGINMAVDDAMQGTISLNAPIRIKKSRLLEVMNALLEQRNYAIVYNTKIDFYEVRPTASLPVGLEGPLATTRIIETPNVKPSSLQQAVTTQLGQGQGGAALRVSYLDNLAVILVTGSPGQVGAFEDVVRKILEKRAEQELIPIDLEHIASTAALTRLLQLVGEQQQQQQVPGFEFDPGQQQGLAGILGSLENLSNRLVVSPQGNALIFRGNRDEADRVRQLVEVIDRPNELTSRKYFTGSATGQIAQLASERGLGAITKFESEFNQFPQFDQQGRPVTDEPALGGSRIVAHEAGGYIVYYGTASQQEQVDSLVKEFKIEGEQVVVRVYMLKHGNAEKMAELIQNLLQGGQTGESPLLPPGTGNFDQGFQPQEPGLGGEEAFSGGENAQVIADIPNNQLVVRAPANQQEEFARLIDKLDLRRPQVYIDVKIVSVTARDEFRLAVETQLIHLADNTLALNTNFGLSNFPEGSSFTDRKSVVTSLTGLTAALIRAEDVPIIITALKRDTDTRILSSPQLLVNNNEEAKIFSIEEQPVSTTTQTTGNPTQTSFGGYEEAGTKLTVTPGISEGGYMRLKYDIELSAFQGPGTRDLPPPKDTRNLTSESVTVPDGMTIVVGGIEVDLRGESILKIPLLGDIPLIGHLFRDTNVNKQSTRLYVFITPRIMRDANFLDLALLTEGPQAKAEIDLDVPEVKPIRIELFPEEPAPAGAAGNG